MDKYRWEIMLSDGSIIKGIGNEKMLITALKTPDIVDGDVWHDGSRKNISFWMFLVK